jgi:ATP-dependent DNA ligase
MTQDRTAALSKLLPPSLGTLFGQPFEKIDSRMPLPNPPANLPGAHTAPELCCIVDQYRPDLLPKDAIAEVKIDGMRSLHIAGRLWTREGSPFEAAEHCLPILRAMESDYGQPMFFDGEFIEDGGLESTIAAFRSRKGSGCLWLFDAVPFDEWKAARPSRLPLLKRKRRLRDVLLRVTEYRSDVPVGYVEHVTPLDERLVELYARDLWAGGFEGLVVKSGCSRYLRKRTCDWMKVKIRSVSTMQVVDVVGCTRNNREEAKALLVRLPGRDMTAGKLGQPCKPIRLSIAPGGLSETLWQRRADLMDGGKVDVEHAGFTGGGNPRDPVLKSVHI